MYVVVLLFLTSRDVSLYRRAEDSCGKSNAAYHLPLFCHIVQPYFRNFDLSGLVSMNRDEATWLVICISPTVTQFRKSLSSFCLSLSEFE